MDATLTSRHPGPRARRPRPREPVRAQRGAFGRVQAPSPEGPPSGFTNAQRTPGRTALSQRPRAPGRRCARAIGHHRPSRRPARHRGARTPPRDGGRHPTLRRDPAGRARRRGHGPRGSHPSPRPDPQAVRARQRRYHPSVPSSSTAVDREAVYGADHMSAQLLGRSSRRSCRCSQESGAASNPRPPLVLEGEGVSRKEPPGWPRTPPLRQPPGATDGPTVTVSRVLNATGRPPARPSASHFRAADEARTRDPQLGKLMLYQLSYRRMDREG